MPHKRKTSQIEKVGVLAPTSQEFAVYLPVSRQFYSICWYCSRIVSGAVIWISPPKVNTQA